MQNPFIAINNLRQQSQAQRQSIGCLYLSQPGQNYGPNDKLVGQLAEVPPIATVLTTDTTSNAPAANYPTSGLSVNTGQLFLAFKSCYFNSVFDPLLTTESLMEGFTRTDADKTLLAHFLHRLFLDINSIAGIFLTGNTYQTAAFRQGRLNLLLYPFMFSENITIQNVSVNKQLSNTIGYFVTKKLLSILSATVPMSQEDVIRQVPIIPFANEILLNQTIEDIINKVNLDIASITSKKQFASNYAESAGTYIGIKVPNSLEYTKLRALGFSILVKQQGAGFVTTFFQTNSIFALILPQDASPSVKLLFQQAGNLYRRYPNFFTRTTAFINAQFNSMPGQNGDRDPQTDQTFFAAVGFHMLYKLMYKKTRYTPFKFRPEQAARQRDLQAQTARLLIPAPPSQVVQQAIVNMDVQFQAANADAHIILDGSNQFLDSLTLKQQRQFVSDFLANQATRLEEQQIPV